MSTFSSTRRRETQLIVLIPCLSKLKPVRKFEEHGVANIFHADFKYMVTEFLEGGDWLLLVHNWVVYHGYKF